MSVPTTKEYAIENILTSAVQLPGVKVNRNKFLAESFSNDPSVIEKITELGPVEAGVSREQLDAITKKHILKRTSQSSIASFTAGIPGGIAMAATIPADVLQFFGMSIRLAQEISYLYGSDDLWQNGKVDEERIKSQLILYFGVMFGVSGAVSGVRVLATQISKVALKKIPQKALTKTFWYPIVKQIGKAIGVKVTKTTVANGVSKAVPIIGGVISGTLNFASMMPMATRLSKTLDKACFDYSEDEFESDLLIIENADENALSEIEKKDEIKTKLSVGIKNAGNGISGAFGKLKGKLPSKTNKTPNLDSSIEDVKKLAELRESGLLTDEEFEKKKKELLDL